MKIFQSGSLARKVKKLRPDEKKKLDLVIRKVIGNPEIGTEKKGDLKGVFIYKFKLQNLEYLLAYRLIKNETLELIMLGPHENYYRKLKGHMK